MLNSVKNAVGFQFSVCFQLKNFNASFRIVSLLNFAPMKMLEFTLSLAQKSKCRANCQQVSIVQRCMTLLW